MKVAFIGYLNIGKSSTVNALLNENRMIVCDVPCIKRDSVSIKFSCRNSGKMDHDFVLMKI